MLIRPFCALLLLACTTSAAFAQSLGPFRWQMQPYCNVLTLNVTQNGGVYTLDGFDDQCGAGARASVTGTAFPNPDGTIGVGLNVVTAPGGTPLHVEVALSLATVSGSWRDSAGGSGTFAFNPTEATGTPRPVAAAIGALAVDPGQIQLRVNGSCETGHALRQIYEDGSVDCLSVPARAISALQTLRGSGLQSNVSGDTAELSLAKTVTGAFDLTNIVGIVSEYSSHIGKEIFLWDSAKSAFRAVFVSATSSDPQSIGNSSVAMGYNTVATGLASFAMGSYAGALARDSVAIGSGLSAYGRSSIALGSNAGTTVAAQGSFVFGDYAPAYSGTYLQSFAPHEFLVRAKGGTRFYSNGVLTAGVKLDPGASAWSSVSDVNMKENFRDLDGDDVLTKLARMPIREWNYKTQDAAIRHVGPTAQDFHSAFGLGEDPLRISTIDAEGIALAGVKALAIENQALRAAVAALSERLERLERTQR